METIIDKSSEEFREYTINNYLLHRKVKILELSKLSADELNSELQKGFDDIDNGRIEDISSIFYDIQGYILCYHNDYKKAEEYYIKASKVFKNKFFIGRTYYNLGLLNYCFKKPDILYSKLYFELALKYEYHDAAYFLATICEEIEDIDNIEHSSEEIKSLYRLASLNARDINVKELSEKRLKFLEENELKLSV